jgi:putative transposase
MPLAIATVDTISTKECIFMSKNYNLKNDNIDYIYNISIGKAVRASMAFPGIFTTCKFEKYNFIDGGTKDNLPIEVLKDMGADVTIGLSFKLDEYNVENQNILSILLRTVDIFSLKDVIKAQKEEITAIYHENKGRYGYRRITLELHNRDFCINHKTVRRLMKELGLQCFVRVQKYRSYKGEVGKICDNLLNREFEAEKPNEKWVTDVTEFKVHNEKLYLSPIVDLFNGEVISFNLSRHPVFAQIADMLEKAFNKIPNNTNLILHSDQGWQYQMKQYQHLLKEKGIRQSMSRKGNCLDNSLAENFFGLLKSELFYMKEYKTIEELEKDIIEYIDYYNNKRIKGKLKGMSPVQYRVHSHVA